VKRASIIIFTLTFFLLSINGYAGIYRNSVSVKDRHDERTFKSGDYGPNRNIFETYSTSLWNYEYTNTRTELDPVWEIFFAQSGQHGSKHDGKHKLGYDEKQYARHKSKVGDKRYGKHEWDNDYKRYGKHEWDNDYKRYGKHEWGDDSDSIAVAAVAPEPVSSILFLFGGIIVAGRCYLKNKRNAVTETT
jgi:hypothetical protein